MKQLRFPTLFTLFVLSIWAPIFKVEGVEQGEFREVFDQYLGVWQGEYRIYSQNDELLNQFKVNRNYWWEDEVLMGRVSYDFGGVKKTYFHRIMLSKGTPFSFVTDRIDADQIKSALSGEILKGTVIWTRVLPKEGLPVRISERISKDKKTEFIEFWGDQEALDANGRSMLVRIEGFLTLMEDSRDFVTASQNDGEIDEERDFVEDVLEAEPEVIKPKPVLKDPTERKTKVAPEQKPEKPEPSEANEALQEELKFLNVVGINEQEKSIVVDYFLYYQIGDRIGTKKACYFAGMDEQYLYFEDQKDHRYRIARKDKSERFSN